MPGARTQKARPTPALRHEDQAPIFALRSDRHASGPQSSLWRAPGHHPLSGPRSALAARRSASALRRRHPSFQRRLPADVNRHLLERPGDHPSLWTAVQDRAQLQAGSTSYRFILLPLLDARHEVDSTQRRDQHLHRDSHDYRSDIKRKMHAYHVFIQAGLVCQGLLQYLAVAFPELVWDRFRSWLRTFPPASHRLSWSSLMRYVKVYPNFS
jgi:hypothetical protein